MLLMFRIEEFSNPQVDGEMKAIKEVHKVLTDTFRGPQNLEFIGVKDFFYAILNLDQLVSKNLNKATGSLKF